IKYFYGGNDIVSITATQEAIELAVNGGVPAVDKFEGVAQPKIGVEEFLAIARRFGFKPDAVERIAQTVSNNDLEGNGPNLAKYWSASPKPASGFEYEAKAREMFDAPFALGVSSGTGALHAAMVAA